jgi:IclR family KDG regulon transcriptional repressor
LSNSGDAMDHPALIVKTGTKIIRLDSPGSWLYLKQHCFSYRDNIMNLLSSVKKSLQELNTFSTEQPDLSVTEISRLLDSHKSSISRILMTLASEGYVEKDPATQKYRLGLKVLELAGRVINRYDLRHLAGPYLDELAKELGEIIHLSILDGNEIVYLEKKGREQPLTVSSIVGGRSPAYASARGKVLLSGLPEKVLMQVITKRPLVRFTANTIVE